MLEVETPETELAELIEWLKQESERNFALHLWDWEVKLLLAALSPTTTEHKPLMTDYSYGGVGDAQRPGHDAPLPGDGWVREKDR